MEPECVADYSRQSYWVQRFETETEYNWFASVHQDTVKAICDELVGVFERRGGRSTGAETGNRAFLRVLHLGTGNSTLCMDLYEEIRSRSLPFALFQVAMDYAPNVIEHMRSRYPPDVLPDTQWVVGDVRQLEQFHEFGPFDVVVERGTMDALEADKDSPTTCDDVKALLTGVSALLQHARGYGAFLQVTWVAPFLRLPYTTADCFCWGDQVRHSLIGGSDIYRLFVYSVKS
ncbi:hypothetical protein ERJ75_001754300 [Trypanosoma vivax]|uniref:Methyltransferase domain-containing protein n=1 Tax=Trypanosoma vivax (strain Y486) TaxID=1055687 RepID=G0U2E1_TRYVY|nr:hypothetical protein TRVL_00939 [Trypanosoma vivax]KAH8604179.1 hypothetical protein ERJ75_001754300 [Trypanosoma vivax]CCC50444.1 conserved hypothetical protein [Trypanosoma vivax Y486]